MHKAHSPKPDSASMRPAELHRGHVGIDWLWPRRKPCPSPHHEGKQVSPRINKNQGGSWSGGLDALSLSPNRFQLDIAQEVHPEAPDWLLIIIAVICRHAGTGTGINSVGLLWYLLISPGSAPTTLMRVPEFAGVLVKGWQIGTSKKQIEFAAPPSWYGSESSTLVL